MHIDPHVAPIFLGMLMAFVETTRPKDWDDEVLIVKTILSNAS